MKIPILYNLRSLRARPVSTLTTAAGMALVVAVFVAMMALSTGFRAALTGTGSPDNVLVLRKGANAEMSSGLGRDAVNVVAGMPFIARNEAGDPLVTAETFVVVSLHRFDGGLANVVVRGVGKRALEVRRGVHIEAGRKFRPGTNEVIVGRRLSGRFPNAEVGDTLHFGGRAWSVVGRFSANGSAFESEIWGESEQLMPVFRGQVFQSITFRMRDPAAFPSVKAALEEDPRLSVDAFREVAFYENQSVILGTILRFIAVFVSGVMAIGAVFGAVNTMYSSVASRAAEIGVLRTLGFKPRSVLASFLLEAVLIALVGGLAGCLLVLPINGLVTSTTNWDSFSEVAFAFRVTPGLLAAGLGFGVMMGLVGGFLPARRAATQPVTEALRSG